MMNADAAASVFVLSDKGNVSAPAGSAVFSMHALDFIEIVSNDDPSALPIEAVAEENGPRIMVDRALFPISVVAEPIALIMWLPVAIKQIAFAALAAAKDAPDGVGALSSPRWQAFRDQAEMTVGLSWNEIVTVARRDGLDSAASLVTEGLFVENGVSQGLMRRMAASSHVN